MSIINKCFDFYKKHKEGLNYLIFGGLTTVLSLAVYYILTFLVLNPNKTIELQIANIVSWTVGFIFAFVTNRKYVFESKNSNVRQEFIKFFLSFVFYLL